MRRYKNLVFIALLILSSCRTQDNNLANTKWVYDCGDSCIDYISFKNENLYEYYSCETGETLFGGFFLSGDSIILQQLEGSYDHEFTKESRHSTPKIRYKMIVKDDFILFIDRWEFNNEGIWINSDFDFPDSYKLKKNSE